MKITFEETRKQSHGVGARIFERIDIAVEKERASHPFQYTHKSHRE